MERAYPCQPTQPRFERLLRLTIWAFIIGVVWAPAVVAVAMILTGHVGD
jgi:hypothetical protein